MSDGITLALIVCCTFLFAGTVKGVVGLGLPSIALGVLTSTVGLQQAMALILAPSFLTNLWQACVGGHAREIMTRAWVFLFMATTTIGLGSLMLADMDVAFLSALLGVVLMLYAGLGLARLRLRISRSWQGRAGLIFGAANGILTSWTGSFAVPGVFYLQSIGLQRDALVQAMGILFTASTVGLALSPGAHGLLTAELGILSTVAIVPALIGMAIGQRLRRRLPDAVFRTTFYIALLLLGLSILIRQIFGAAS